MEQKEKTAREMQAEEQVRQASIPSEVTLTETLLQGTLS